MSRETNKKVWQVQTFTENLANMLRNYFGIRREEGISFEVFWAQSHCDCVERHEEGLYRRLSGVETLAIRFCTLSLYFTRAMTRRREEQRLKWRKEGSQNERKWKANGEEKTEERNVDEGKRLYSERRIDYIRGRFNRKRNPAAQEHLGTRGRTLLANASGNVEWCTYTKSSASPIWRKRRVCRKSPRKWNASPCRSTKQLGNSSPERISSLFLLSFLQFCPYPSALVLFSWLRIYFVELSSLPSWAHYELAYKKQQASKNLWWLEKLWWLVHSR